MRPWKLLSRVSHVALPGALITSCLVSPKDYPVGDLDGRGSAGAAGSSTGATGGAGGGGPGKGGNGAGGTSGTGSGTGGTGASSGAAGSAMVGGMSSLGGESAGGASSGAAGAGGAGGAPEPMTVTFGERDTSDHKNVTFDNQLTGAPSFESYNNGGHIHIGIDGDPLNYGILRFDLSALPATATVLGATLSLWTDACPGCEANVGTTVVLYRVLEEWDEGDTFNMTGASSWLERKTGLSWSSPGAEPPSRATTASASFAPTALSTEWPIALPVALIQGWVDGSLPNYGFVLRAEPNTGDGMALISSENTNSSARPELTVEVVF